jgi:transposase
MSNKLQQESTVLYSALFKKHSLLQGMLCMLVVNGLLSQSEAAELAGVNKSTISRWVQKGTYAKKGLENHD